MEEIIKICTTTIAQIIEFLAAIIICYASLKAVIYYFKDSVSKVKKFLPDTNIRLSLGKSLAIALELLLGADILKTALAAIATLRTALNYFLERELKMELRQHNG
jgi:uncharacterized membrane protein